MATYFFQSKEDEKNYFDLLPDIIGCPACGHDQLQLFEVILGDHVICNTDTGRRCEAPRVQIWCLGCYAINDFLLMSDEAKDILAGKRKKPFLNLVK